MAEQPKRIGELNGPYAALFKLSLLSYPVFITTFTAWAVWVTSNVYDYLGWKAQGERFTAQHGQVLANSVKDDIRRELSAQFNQLEVRIEQMQAVQITMRESIFELRAEFKHTMKERKDNP